MRLLIIDADFFNYRPSVRAKFSRVSELSQDSTCSTYEECLVVMIAVESGDSDATMEAAAVGILQVADEFRQERIILVPNVHLTDRPKGSARALRLLKQLKRSLNAKGKGLVFLEAFGYGGPWSIHAKGHERSVLGRRY